MFKKVFKFEKVSLGGSKKIYPVEIEAQLTDDNVFTCSGTIWNSKKTDCIAGGQCLDEINTTHLTNNSTFKKLYRFWKLYHLNDMHAGTPKQEKILNDYFKDSSYDYDTAVKVLEEHNCYIDNNYRYGSSWLKEEIPESDLLEIKNLLQ